MMEMEEGRLSGGSDIVIKLPRQHSGQQVDPVTNRPSLSYGPGERLLSLSVIWYCPGSLWQGSPRCLFITGNRPEVGIGM